MDSVSLGRARDGRSGDGDGDWGGRGQEKAGSGRAPLDVKAEASKVGRQSEPASSDLRR
jgi:hypothetical protein